MAGMGKGNFYAEPNPDIKMEPPGRILHFGKFCSRSIGFIGSSLFISINLNFLAFNKKPVRLVGLAFYFFLLAIVVMSTGKNNVD
jgi:hypothetical protein